MLVGGVLEAMFLRFMGKKRGSLDSGSTAASDLLGHVSRHLGLAVLRYAHL